MTASEINVASYIRERSEELRKLSKDARLDLLVHIFGVAALEATKHERIIAPPAVPGKFVEPVDPATYTSPEVG